MTRLEAIIIGGVVFVAVLCANLVGGLVEKPLERQVLGSVSQGSEYHATTTNESTVTKELYLSSSTQSNTIYDTQQGALGSIYIAPNVSGSGVLTVYDATTTIASKRATKFTSSSIIIASVQLQNTSTVPLVFDAFYQYGLIAVFTGTMPNSSTITWR